VTGCRTGVSIGIGDKTGVERGLVLNTDDSRKYYGLVLVSLHFARSSAESPLGFNLDRS
jgi:hypothetical protein